MMEGIDGLGLQMICYGGVAAVFFIILRQLTLRSLRLKIQEIKTHLADLEIKKQRTEADLFHCHDRISLLDREADSIISEYIRQGNEAGAGIINKAADAVQMLEAQAQRRIQKTRYGLKTDLEKKIIERALSLSEKEASGNIMKDRLKKSIYDHAKKAVAS